MNDPHDPTCPAQSDPTRDADGRRLKPFALHDRPVSFAVVEPALKVLAATIQANRCDVRTALLYDDIARALDLPTVRDLVIFNEEWPTPDPKALPSSLVALAKAGFPVEFR